LHHGDVAKELDAPMSTVTSVVDRLVKGAWFRASGAKRPPHYPPGSTKQGANCCDAW